MGLSDEQEFQYITKETANEFVKAFEALGEAINDSDKTYNHVLDLHFQNLKSKHESGVLYYTQKVETSCFITRWWYKRKLQKEKDRLEAINVIIKEYYESRGSDKSPA